MSAERLQISRPYNQINPLLGYGFYPSGTSGLVLHVKLCSNALPVGAPLLLAECNRQRPEPPVSTYRKTYYIAAYWVRDFCHVDVEDDQLLTLDYRSKQHRRSQGLTVVLLCSLRTARPETLFNLRSHSGFYNALLVETLMAKFIVRTLVAKLGL